MEVNWLAKRLNAPATMLDSDADAKALFSGSINLPMPNQNLDDKEIARYVKYFHWADAQPKAPAASPAAGH